MGMAGVVHGRDVCRRSLCRARIGPIQPAAGGYHAPGVGIPPPNTEPALLSGPLRAELYATARQTDRCGARMTLRYHRRLTIFPGLHLNLSRSGASVSVGRKGFWATGGPRGRHLTAGIPGTGLSWTERAPPLVALAPGQSFLAVWGWPLVILAIVAIAWWLG
jgi:hypothetical protein